VVTKRHILSGVSWHHKKAAIVCQKAIDSSQDDKSRSGARGSPAGRVKLFISEIWCFTFFFILLLIHLQSQYNCDSGQEPSKRCKMAESPNRDADENEYYTYSEN
jgi:hypothetical protein